MKNNCGFSTEIFILSDIPVLSSKINVSTPSLNLWQPFFLDLSRIRVANTSSNIPFATRSAAVGKFFANAFVI